MLAIIGPTASGKSSVGEFLVRNLNFSVINFDSCQFCSELNTLKSIPQNLDEHYLYSFFSNEEKLTVFNWGQLALNAISKVHSKGRSPVLIGGTAFYLKSFFLGIDLLPPILPEIAQFVAGLSFLDVKNLLVQYDPFVLKVYFDERRLRKALAFFLSHNFSLLKSYGKYPHSFWNNEFKILALIPPKEILQAKIYKRLVNDFDLMEQEVRNCTLNLPHVIGFAEIKDFMEGKISREDCLNLIFIRTRRYAKRQITFIKNSLPIFEIFDDSLKLQEYIYSKFC